MTRDTQAPRFYCPSLPDPRLSEGRCVLDQEQSRHLRKVLRVREGDAVELFNGQGMVGRASVLGFDAGCARCQVTDVAEHPAPRPTLTLAAALPKGPLADTMVNMLSQAGADVLTPTLMQRSVVDPRAGKVDRLAKLAVASAKQCGRPWLMQVTPPMPLGQVLRQPRDLALVMDRAGAAIDDLPQRLRRARRVTLIVGPEGGLTESELREAEHAGFRRWSVGPHTLRIETAACIGVGVLRYLHAAGSHTGQSADAAFH